MGITKKQSFSKESKTKVVLEALREETTLQEISVKYKVHPNRVSQWKKQAVEGLPEGGAGNGKDRQECDGEASQADNAPFQASGGFSGQESLDTT
jgi:transposase-like protein